MQFHISRWHYWWLYLLAFVLFLLSVWRLFSGAIKSFLLLCFFLLVLFGICEFLVRLERVTITDEGIEFRKGILSRNVTRTAFHAISNVFVRQSMFQRIFGFGNVDIDTAGGPEPEIILHNFQKAGKIEEVIQSHIQKTRHAVMTKK